MTAGPEQAAPRELPAPSLRRRVACMLYEGVLLFGVVVASAYLYSSLTQQRHALQGSTGLQAFVFVVLGIYFAGFWSRSGQTLAMKTWHIRVQMPDGRPPTQLRALMRYVLGWVWFLPALASVHYAGVRGLGATLAVVAAGMLAYLLMARAHPSRQFLHDLICGTRLVDTRAAAAAPAQSAA
jgi:uncharacterized RDD family membrane protein YckC